jgi:hypothetical protein
VQHTEPEVVAQIEPEREVALSHSSNEVYAQPEAPVQPEFQPARAQEALPVAARNETPRQEQVHRPLTQDDIKDLVAPIREAAISISAAITQAAEWLRSKEEEILRHAETPSAQPSAQLPRGPQLVDKRPRVPFWKRIDWDKEFTPGRAAILGALAMAVLMVLGISLARRPASSILPQQTQTHVIQPGGVTLTSHPVRSTQRAAPSVESQQRSTVPAHPVAPAARHAYRTSNADDGPDVVTHYYGNKSKPSPTHQSTIAGVHHYSDMQ